MKNPTVAQVAEAYGHTTGMNLRAPFKALDDVALQQRLNYLMRGFTHYDLASRHESTEENRRDAHRRREVMRGGISAVMGEFDRRHAIRHSEVLDHVGERKKKKRKVEASPQLSSALETLLRG